MRRNFFDESPYCTEYNAEGTCTFDPSIISIKESILHYLKQLAYYTLKLLDYDYEEEETIKLIFQMLSSVIVNADFNSSEFKNAILKIKTKIKEYEDLYKKLSIEKQADYQLLKSFYDNSNSDENMSTIIRQGEKQLIKKNIDLSKDVRNLHEIILQLIRSASVSICELDSYESDTKKFQYPILKLLNNLNFTQSTPTQIKRKIINFSSVNYELMVELDNLKRQKYGETSKVDVSFTKKVGKAILVSGHNFEDLENLLDTIGDEKIDVYTHNGMLLAHTYKKFQQYPQLVGHYQTYLNSSPSDFATFPGPILVTKTPQDEIDCFIRGRLYTTAMFSGLGIIKIRNNDFKPIIDAAKAAKGFKKEIPEEPFRVGYSEEKMSEIIDNIVEKYKKNEINHLYLIKVNNGVEITKYFKEFVKNLTENAYVICSFKPEHTKNFNYIDGHYDFSVMYNFLAKLTKKMGNDRIPMSIFISHCNVHTISHVLNLKYLGINNIYL